MKKIIKDNLILVLCYVSFLFFLFKKLNLSINWLSIWGMPTYQMNTLRMIPLNLPWLGISFYHFIMMRADFENSFVLHLIRFELTAKVWLVFNRKLFRYSLIAGTMYIVIAQLISVVTRFTWIKFNENMIVYLMLMIIIIFMMGLLQLAISLFLDTRMGLLIQLCYSIFSLLIGRILELNNHTRIWEQIFFWPQWLTLARLLNLYSSVSQILGGLILIILILEITLYFSIRKKDWLG